MASRLLMIAVLAAAFAWLTAMPVAAQNPGFKVAITDIGLQEINQLSLPFLLSALSSLSIPDQSGTTDGIDYKLSSIVVKKVTIEAIKTSIVAGKGLDVEFTGVGAELSLDWKVKWEIVSDSGSADASTSGSKISSTIAISQSEGRPTVQASGTDVDLQDFQIQIHGPGLLNWILEQLEGLIQGDIKHLAEQAIGQALQDAINQGAEKQLATLPVIEPINKYAQFDFSMLASVFESSYFTTEHLGKFEPVYDPSHADPFQPGPLPDLVSGSRAINAIIGQYVGDTFGETMLLTNQLQTVVYPKDLPSDSPVKLNTSEFKFIVPELYSTYPDQAMALVANATQAPSISIQSSGIEVVVEGILQVDVINDYDSANTDYAGDSAGQGELVNAFVLNMNISMGGTASIQGNTLYGTLEWLNTTISLCKSNIGEITMFPLDFAVKELSKAIVVQFNKAIAAGFPLPVTSGFYFDQPELVLGDGYIAILSDVGYKS